MKIATWNVNGIRARAAQVCEFLERESPDVLCLQELKAERRPGAARVPRQRLPHLLAWLDDEGVLGRVAAYQGDARAKARFHASGLRHGVAHRRRHSSATRCSPRSTCRTAARTIRRSSTSCSMIARLGEARARRRQRARALRRHQHRAHRARRASGRAQANVIGQLPEERALFEELIGEHLVDVRRALDPDNERPIHLVGALAQDARAQHRLAPGLHPRLASRSPTAPRAASCSANSAPATTGRW